MIKVAQILYSGLGGHASVVFSMIEADASRRWQCSLGFLGVEPLATGFSEFCAGQSVPYVYFQAIAGKPWRNWHSIFHWLRREQPEVVILHNASALVPTWWYSRTRKTRILVVEHTPANVKSTGEWLFTSLAMLGAHEIVMLTPEQKLELSRTLGPLFRERKTHLIANGVNTERYAPAPALGHGVNRPQRIRVGMAGRFIPIKRHDCLVSMMAHLRQMRPDIEWCLSLAGEGVTFPQIKAQIENEGLEDCVELPGMLTQVQVLNWYRSMDIYVHAAEAEILSTAILQAMAMQLPIVATDVPGIRNLLVHDEDCGLLVSGFDPQEYATAVLSLVEDSGRASELSDNARQRSVNTYGHQAMFLKYDALAIGTAH